MKGWMVKKDKQEAGDKVSNWLERADDVETTDLAGEDFSDVSDLKTLSAIEETCRKAEKKRRTDKKATENQKREKSLRSGSTGVKNHLTGVTKLDDRWMAKWSP